MFWGEEPSIIEAWPQRARVCICSEYSSMCSQYREIIDARANYMWGTCARLLRAVVWVSACACVSIYSTIYTYIVYIYVTQCAARRVDFVMTRFDDCTRSAAAVAMLLICWNYSTHHHFKPKRSLHRTQTRAYSKTIVWLRLRRQRDVGRTRSRSNTIAKRAHGRRSI